MGYVETHVVSYSLTCRFFRGPKAIKFQKFLRSAPTMEAPREHGPSNVEDIPTPLVFTSSKLDISS